MKMNIELNKTNAASILTGQSDRRRSRAQPSALRYAFSVAQIFNLPYRRFVIGRTLLAGRSSQVINLRYSRLEFCATGEAHTLNKYALRGEREPEGQVWVTRHLSEFLRGDITTRFASPRP